MRSKNVCIHFVIRKNVCVHARVFIQLLFRNISQTQRSIQMESDYRVINKSSVRRTDIRCIYLSLRITWQPLFLLLLLTDLSVDENDIDRVFLV